MEKSEEKNKYIGLLDFFKNYTIQWKIYPQFNITKQKQVVIFKFTHLDSILTINR